MQTVDAAPPPHNPDNTYFLMDEAALRRRRNLKWSSYGENVLPAFVAEMDYAAAPAIADALSRITTNQQYGYPARSGSRTPDSVARLYAERMSRIFDWRPDPKNIVVVSDLVQAIFTTVLAFSKEGDGIAVQEPCYPPFRDAIVSTGRLFTRVETVDDGNRLSIDFDSLAKTIGPQTRLLMLCNPHNPTGRVLARQDLEKLAKLALAHDLLIVSDEVHCEITFDQFRHIPIASLDEEIGRRTITLGSAAKSFNTAGLKCAFVHFGTAALRDLYLKAFPGRVIVPGHVMGIDATIAAWEHSHQWQHDVLSYLAGMRGLLMQRLGKDLPGIRVHAPEGTYMAWLDCRALGLPSPVYDFFLSEAKVALSAGQTFVTGGEAFARLNFATSETILSEILDRMTHAVRTRA
ncbi:MalY/PatB family protein [Neorhizobium sp. T6_25]|uniref:MalY/PatB family protein n=1 Tax=Neorhizobium sp. T6_25 TaxID=2093833 RepID=UPI000CF9B7D3|nr:aminotransferase class I/II-fold pyridoxal phosphate-dependent enzyme [Neorhizobium sp. T6_25]